MDTLQALLRIVHDDLGVEQEQQFLVSLKAIDDVCQDITSKLSRCSESDAAKLLSDLSAFDITTMDYFREVIRRVAVANISSGRWRVTNVEIGTV